MRSARHVASHRLDRRPSAKPLIEAKGQIHMTQIKPLGAEFEEYLRDESRSVGSAESIVFPESEADVRDALHALHATGVPVTVQGARSG